ncbi:hypothetical protein [Mycoplasma miroungirhinis]|uniref:Uncharacterized protein n=1 Tax=Mycoplasma miroungirhinis TaxID=754516 RepID=A0A6M4JCX5_9MOLU|nr:hypothetical protein [Mycoplasma miroungirhinis]QJR43919.1 hypothetical protein HLA92_00425 [Mycoplasma miroungirhinis]
MNIKTENLNSTNSAVDSIKKLYNDYLKYYNIQKDFYFVILKKISIKWNCF